MDGDSPEINDTLSDTLTKPLGAKPRPPIRLKGSEVNNCLKEHTLEELHMKGMPRHRQKSVHESDGSSDDNSDHGKQVTDHSDEKLDEQEPLNYLSSKSSNRSRTTSPERTNNNIKNKSSENFFRKSPSKEEKLYNNEQNKNSYRWIGIIMLVIVVLYFSSTTSNSTSGSQTEPTNSRNTVFKLIEDVKNKFYHQDSHIWNEISSGINEVKTRIPKVPSIILLFANETHTMDCLALALAHVSSNILGGDSPLNLNPKDFGDDPGEIIHSLKKDISTKKTVIIRDLLNINTEAIKALHNLCDRINPLIPEVIYIITMQTKNYESSQHKMAFVEKQLYRELSKNIDEDILTALVTRITDGAIISVKPEPNLRYC